MQAYELTLESPVSKTFRCQKAADSLDIDTAKKAVHHLKVEADLDGDWNVGLVVGASGSGKTTLAQHVWGDDCFRTLLKDNPPIIDQFPKAMSYDDCVGMLNGVGLSQVVCWIRPAYTLSNGQRARAEIALQMAKPGRELTVIDEWTSVVDRTVAKVMSHCIAKHARRQKARVVLCSCHYDVVEWLDPDWIIDCNRQSFADRRLLQPGERTRQERLTFDLREADRSTWRYFSRYHYLSERLPGGEIYCFGVFHGDDQIGFQCFANYVPHTVGTRKQLHSNRTVIHPDYVGFGLGIKVINATSRIMHARGFDIRARFSSLPVYRAMSRQAEWKLLKVDRNLKVSISKSNLREGRGVRIGVRTFSFRYEPVAEAEGETAAA